MFVLCLLLFFVEDGCNRASVTDLLLCSEIFVVAAVVVSFSFFYLCLFQGEEVEAAGGGLLMIYVCC